MPDIPRHYGGVPTFDPGLMMPAGCGEVAPPVTDCSAFSDFARTVDVNLITPDLGYTLVSGASTICPCSTALSGTLFWQRESLDSQLFPTYTVNWRLSSDLCERYVNLRIECTRNQTTGFVEYFRIVASITWCDQLTGACGEWRLDVPPPLDTERVYSLPYYEFYTPTPAGCEGESNNAPATFSFSPI